MTPYSKPPPAVTGRRLPAWLMALAAQAAGWLVAFGLLALPSVPSFPSAAIVAVQAVIAAFTAWRLGCERWWLAIHLAFSPLLIAALALGIDPRWYFGAFVALLLVYWGTLASRVPLFLSGRATVDAVDRLLPRHRPLRVLDIGSGLGSLLAPLARRHPACDFHGIESAPAPWLLSSLRARGQGNLSFRRGDFFNADWGAYDVVYAYLSPHPMRTVWEKAEREMRPSALLVSKDFPVPDAAPSTMIALPHGTLYCYFPGKSGSNAD